MNETLSGNSDYEQRIKDRIVLTLSSGPKSVGEIVARCRGAYPTIVMSCLNGLGGDVFPLGVEGFGLGRRFTSNEQLESALDQIDGNPVLSSWYFTRDTCKAIVSLRDWQNTRIAFLGAPRLFEWFVQNRIGEERALLDLDDRVLSEMNRNYRDNRNMIMQYDARTDPPTNLLGRYDYVFFDPPWYPEDYITWMHRASQISANGNVCFSLFPELTRPNAGQGRARILEIVRSNSEEHFLIESFLHYEVPTFERQQLNASGMDWLKSWKVSDMVLVQGLKPVELELDSGKSSYGEWTEIELGSIRIFVDSNSARAQVASNLLASLTPERSILPSPSHRNLSYRNANVLTSRGHGMLTNDPRSLVALLTYLSEEIYDGRRLQDDLEDLDIEIDSEAYVCLTALLQEAANA